MTDLKLDPKNANNGTPRGRELLKESVETCGIGRGVSADKHGTIFAGNKTYTTVRELGKDVELVESSGHEVIVVQRMDLDLLKDDKARKLAYYDNRVAQVDLAWVGLQIRADVLAGVNVGEAFFPEELSALVSVDLQPGKALDLTVEADPLADVKPATPIKKAARPSFVLDFTTVEQRLRWNAFMRRLRHRFPSAATPAASLVAYLEAGN